MHHATPFSVARCQLFAGHHSCLHDLMARKHLFLVNYLLFFYPSFSGEAILQGRGRGCKDGYMHQALCIYVPFCLCDKRYRVRKKRVCEKKKRTLLTCRTLWDRDRIKKKAESHHLTLSGAKEEKKSEQGANCNGDYFWRGEKGKRKSTFSMPQVAFGMNFYLVFCSLLCVQPQQRHPSHDPYGTDKF